MQRFACLVGFIWIHRRFLALFCCLYSASPGLINARFALVPGTTQTHKKNDHRCAMVTMSISIRVVAAKTMVFQLCTHWCHVVKSDNTSKNIEMGNCFGRLGASDTWKWRLVYTKSIVKPKKIWKVNCHWNSDILLSGIFLRVPLFKVQKLWNKASKNLVARECLKLGIHSEKIAFLLGTVCFGKSI